MENGFKRKLATNKETHLGLHKEKPLVNEVDKTHGLQTLRP